MDDLLCGAATRDITPAFPAWLEGYQRDRLSDGVAEPIALGCLALRHGAKTLLLVTIDMIGIPSHVCEQLYALLEREVGVAYPDVVVACSHTHFAPALHAARMVPDVGIVEPDSRFVADVETKLAEAARESLRALAPVQLETLRVPVPAVLFNRRTVRQDGTVETNFVYPEQPDRFVFSPVDPELAVLRFAGPTHHAAVLANFGCHPVTGGEHIERDHCKVSGDYPFYLKRALTDAYQCPAFFTLGGAGDAVPINRRGDCRRRIGRVLGDSAVLAERRYAADKGPGLASDVLELEAPTIMPLELARAEHDYARTTVALARAAEIRDGEPGQAEYRQAKGACARAMNAVHRARLYPTNSHILRVQLLKIGGSVLVTMPFEVLSEIALRLKRACPNAILLSCAGGYQGYLPLEHEYARGGYEATATSTHFVPGTADRLLEAIEKRLV